MIGDNWVISTLEWALESWNGKLSELWDLLTQTPESFKGGDIWEVIVTINSALQGVGYGLLVLFFAMGVFQSAASFREIQRPEYALRHFIRFAAAKVAVDTTEVKNIWKANGAKPGMVLYEVYTTVYVTPREKLLDELKVHAKK